jgi:uncharacterized coiled-coil protein SlyX
MIHLDSYSPDIGKRPRSDSQPIALAAILLLLIVIGIGSIALWRATTESISKADRIALARLLHSPTAQNLNQLADRTRGLETSQQEAIDQLQMVQDELQTVKRLLASEEADKKRLADQVAVLTEAVDGLRQSFASAPPDNSPPPETRPASTRTHALNGIHHRRKAKI